MKYFIYKDFRDAVAILYQKGGIYQKAADKVYAVLGKVDKKIEDSDPMQGLSLTDHGESRIKHCLKYELGGGCRLVTICDNGIHVLCFVGKHEDTDAWLDKNRGLSLTLNEKNQLTEVFCSEDITIEDRRINTDAGRSTELLIKKISERHLNRISADIPWSLLNKFAALKSGATEEEIMEIACEIPDKEKQNLFFDVFSQLRNDDKEGAKRSIEVYLENLLPVSSASAVVIEGIEAGDSFIDIDDLTPELFEHFVKTAPFQKWMLFMHPDQRKIVERDFNGPAKLVGVSGSGKTCIIVKRAVHLAQQYPNDRILVLTLNKSLAALIESLINHVCQQKDRQRIEVYSFWKFCQIKLHNFEPQNKKIYKEITWKTNEHIDEVWTEFYECKLNNEDANILSPVNKSLLTRSVFPKDYMRQEFDWIRSALPSKKRSNYLAIERGGRTEPFTKEFREVILKGLDAWEEKMEFVGVIDYLGLSNALHKYLKEMRPEYRCILVDEVQDFGTVELEIIRRLVSEEENDIFLCGDVAQQVYSKHHKLREAGINVIGRSLSIKKNYRNSREILGAAYAVLQSNVDFTKLKNDDFEILEPEYANFSTPKPLILNAANLDKEFGSCYNYLKKNLEPGQKACISICGYSIYDIKGMGEKLGLPVLDGNANVDSHNIFLSDLEQTKGFEFDTVCIINCNQTVIPNPTFPKDEWYREILKFYVAMTRAKLSLIISYSTGLSEIINKSKAYFNESSWREHEAESLIVDFEMPLPMVIKNETNRSFLGMNGEEFLYTKKAVGISKELCEKFSSLITGTNLKRDGRPREWRTIGDALKETDFPAVVQRFGPQTYQDFKKLFEGYTIPEGS